MDELMGIKDIERLKELEVVIEEHVEKFISVGLALREINLQRLYRRDYETFEEYCDQRWEIKRRTAYNYIEAYAAYENVRNCAQIKCDPVDDSEDAIDVTPPTLPANEAQVRPLLKLKRPEDQAAVWSSAVSAAPDGKVTASIVQSAVRRFLGEAVQSKARKASAKVKESTLPNEFKELFYQMANYIRKTRDGAGKRTREEMRRYINNLSELLSD